MASASLSESASARAAGQPTPRPGLLASGSAQAAAENAEQAADAAESSASAAAPTNDVIAAIERAARGA